MSPRVAISIEFIVAIGSLFRGSGFFGPISRLLLFTNELRDPGFGTYEKSYCPLNGYSQAQSRARSPCHIGRLGNYAIRGLQLNNRTSVSPTRFGLAFPLESFITCPFKKLIAASFPVL